MFHGPDRRQSVLSALATLGVAVVVLTGCSSVPDDIADPAKLPAGPCRQAAPALNQLHRDVAVIADKDTTTKALRTGLKQSQDTLRALPEPDSPKVAGSIGDLVEAIGGLRFGIDAHTYDDSALTRVDDAAQKVVTACQSA